MVPLLTPILAALVLAQSWADRPAIGEVIDDQGKPVADALVLLWSPGNANWLEPNTVELNNGPLRSTADGSFQTPDNLMAGSLGRVDEARTLFAEGLRIAGQFTDQTDLKRGWFGARLARVDLPAALTIAKDFDGDPRQGRVLGSIALRLIDQNPPAAERVWNQTKGMLHLTPVDPTLCWTMAVVDPARARRAIKGLGETQSKPGLYLFLALGSKDRDNSPSCRVFQTGLEGIDRLLRERPEQYQIE